MKGNFPPGTLWFKDQVSVQKVQSALPTEQVGLKSVICSTGPRYFEANEMAGWRNQLSVQGCSRGLAGPTHLLQLQLGVLPWVATVHFLSLHIHDRDAVQDARTCRSATRSSSRNFPVSCHPQIAPGQERCGARKGCELGNRVAFSTTQSSLLFTLYTRHPENTLGQDRGRTHVPTTLCLIITRFLAEGLFF